MSSVTSGNAEQRPMIKHVQKDVHFLSLHFNSVWKGLRGVCVWVGGGAGTNKRGAKVVRHKLYPCILVVSRKANCSCGEGGRDVVCPCWWSSSHSQVSPHFAYCAVYTLEQ